MSTAIDPDVTLDPDADEDLDAGISNDEPASTAEPRSPTTPTRHVPGGLPAVPLTIIGANSTVATVSAAVIAAGAVDTGLVAGGLAATAVGAAILRRRRAARKTGRARNRAAGGTGAARGRSAALGGGRRASAATAGSRPGGTRAAAPGGARALRAAGQAAKARPTAAGSPKGGRGWLGAVKKARADRKATAPTRAHRRRQDTADQRRVADARAATKAKQKATRKAAKQAARGKGPAAGKLDLTKSPKNGADTGSDRARKAARKADAGKASARERMRQARRRLRDHSRAAQDARTKRRLSRMADLRKRARARTRMWRRLAASALRCHSRKLLAAGIAIPFFALGVVSHPLGRWLGWQWLQNPGQRIYRRLAAEANRARAERDAEIRNDYIADLEVMAEADQPVAAAVRRAPRNYRNHDSPRGTSTGGSTMSAAATGPGFLFNEAAADLEAAASVYDPAGMMDVHDLIEGFPDGLESIAKVFAILAHKADAQFPLEPEVGATLDEVYKSLQQAIDQAEDAFKTFRRVHEQDIRRHEDPRNGAEEGWDTTNN